MHAIKRNEFVTARPGLNLCKAFWACALAMSGIVGIGGGIAGLLLSFLAAEGAVEPSSGVRLAVPALIVLSLTSLMGFAHAMDRLHEMNDRK